MEIVKLKLSELEPNAGQIPGLPTNPRQWTKTDVDKLARSLKETPELFEARPIIAVPHGGRYVILGGNMRYEASKVNKAEAEAYIEKISGYPFVKSASKYMRNRSNYAVQVTPRLAVFYEEEMTALLGKAKNQA